jgi:hypothetical protein
MEDGDDKVFTLDDIEACLKGYERKHGMSSQQFARTKKANMTPEQQKDCYEWMNMIHVHQLMLEDRALPSEVFIG